MRVTVQFWGAAKRVAEQASREVRLAPDSTVASLAAELASSDAMRDLLKRCAFSIGTELVARRHVLKDGDEVAVLPPVNGG